MEKITILLSEDAFDLRHAGEIESKVRIFFDERNVSIYQNDPGTTNKELSRYYTINIDQNINLNEFIEELNAQSFIEAAYVKAADSPPR